MKNESVAILDIRSYEITFFLGSKGVNGTFVFYGSHTEKYEGFCSEGFFDEDSFRRAVVAAVTSVRQTYEGVIGDIYVSVPAPFVSVLTKGHTISFPKKRKISLQDIDALFESGQSELLGGGEMIRRSAMYFTLGDNRKYFTADDLYGVPTTLLQGALCYYYASEKFVDVVSSVIKDLGFNEPTFLPSTLAQALYLLPPKRREGYAFLLDVGFISTSISVVYGNGIVREQSFDYGFATVLVSLMKKLDIECEIAEEILRSANVSGGSVPKELEWTSENGEFTFPVWQINEIIKCSLDVLCEDVENFFTENYREKAASALAVNPISLTGEAIGGVAGAAEHLSKRLNRLTETVAPDLPYYDKPVFSSRIALLNMALSEQKKRGWFYKIFNNFGGKKK